MENLNTNVIFRKQFLVKLCYIIETVNTVCVCVLIAPVHFYCKCCIV